MGGTSCVRTGRHGLSAVMVSMKWPHVGSTTLVLQTDNCRTVILIVSVDECSDDKET